MTRRLDLDTLAADLQQPGGLAHDLAFIEAVRLFAPGAGSSGSRPHQAVISPTPATLPRTPRSGWFPWRVNPVWRGPGLWSVEAIVIARLVAR